MVKFKKKRFKDGKEIKYTIDNAPRWDFLIFHLSTEFLFSIRLALVKEPVKFCSLRRIRKCTHR